MIKWQILEKVCFSTFMMASKLHFVRRKCRKRDSSMSRLDFTVKIIKAFCHEWLWRQRRTPNKGIQIMPPLKKVNPNT
jgi:hypothetical protein